MTEDIQHKSNTSDKLTDMKDKLLVKYRDWIEDLKWSIVPIQCQR